MTLQEFFQQHSRAALGFSGGVDSSFLLWSAVHCGAEVRAYYVRTAFQPEFEYEDAMKLAASLGISPTVLELDILSCEEVIQNPSDRCYHCKKRIFGAVSKKALEDGYTVLLDGTNASDDAGDRPGMRALQELSVLSPLRMCGLTKPEIRRLSREAGLFTWNKPAYACLATRASAGERLTAENLARTEQAEAALQAIGFNDFRVRHRQNDAILEVTKSQMPQLFAQRDQITVKLRELGYQRVTLDLTGRSPSL